MDFERHKEDIHAAINIGKARNYFPVNSGLIIPSLKKVGRSLIYDHESIRRFFLLKETGLKVREFNVSLS